MATPAVRATTNALTVGSGSGTTTSVTINNPSSTFGDLLVVEFAYGVTADTVTPPSGQGWTAIGNGGSLGVNVSAFYRFVGVSDPTSFTFTVNDVTSYFSGIMTAVSGCDPSTPVQSYNITVAGSTTQTTTSITPTRIGCLPLAVFGLKQPNSSNPNVSGLTSGWSQLAINTYPNAVYQANQMQVGPITSDTTTAITATGNWDASGTTPGVTSLIMLQPGIPSAVGISPSPINLAGVGATQTVTITQTGSTTPITLTLSDTTKASLSKSTANPPSDTVTITALAPTSTYITLTAAGN